MTHTKTRKRTITRMWALTLLGLPVVAQGQVFVDADAPDGCTGLSLETALNDLNDALGVAVNGEEIWIAAGTYTPAPPNGSRGATFLLNRSVTLLGGFAGDEESRDMRSSAVNQVILSGDLNGDDGENFANNADNSRHVVTVSTNGVVIDGVTISGGNADGDGSDRAGGGILLTGTSPEIVSCTITGNSAAGTGGGIYGDGGASPRITGSTIANNQAARGGGIYLTNGSMAGIIKVTFEGNSAENEGGGLYVAGSSPTIVSSIFAGNTATNGAGAFLDGETMSSWSNTVFSGNRASEDGGGMYDRGVTDLFNATFAGNEAGGVGGGLIVDRLLDDEGDDEIVAPRITNSVLWDNTDSSGDGEDAQINVVTGTPEVRFSCVQNLSGALGGNGNIGDDPLFVDPDGLDDEPGTGDDIHYLGESSPCVDAGDTADRDEDRLDINDDGSDSDLMPFDYDLNPRVLDDPSVADTGVAGADGVIDMGAFERQGRDCNNNRLLDADEIELGLPDPCEMMDDDDDDDNGNDNGDDNGDDNGNDNGDDNGDDDNGDDNGNGGGLPIDVPTFCAPGMLLCSIFVLFALTGWRVSRRRV